MKGLKEYQNLSNQTDVMKADGHQLISLLLNKALESIAAAKANIEHQRFDEKSRHINKAIEVIGGLREFLDFDKGGEIAVRLEQLYEWSERTLFAATTQNDIEMLDQVAKVIGEIREGWTGIKEQVSSSEMSNSSDAISSQ